MKKQQGLEEEAPVGVDVHLGVDEGVLRQEQHRVRQPYGVRLPGSWGSWSGCGLVSVARRC